MKVKLITMMVIASKLSYGQIVVNNYASDSVLYSQTNYIPNSQQQASNGVYTIVYNNISDPSYQMKKIFMDSAGTKLLSTTFYHQNKLHGPYESFQIDKPLAKGRYKEDKLDGERITYWSNGTTIMEKANYSEGKRSGVWEYYDLVGRLKRKVTYSNGIIVQDQQF